MANKHPRGAAILISILVIMAVVLSIGTTIALIGRDEIVLSGIFQDGETAFSIADACTEEGTMRLKADPAYVGGSFPLDGGTCTVTVASLGTNRWLVTGTGTYASNQRIVNADVSLIFNGSGKAKHITINSWTEAE